MRHPNHLADWTCSSTMHASKGPGVPFDERTDDDWLAIVNVSLNDAFVCAREAVRMMKQQDPHGGRIVNNGWISALVPRPNSGATEKDSHLA